ncbi:MAG: phosphate ABC transporter substrate-binding/OmpA family protein [Pseudomonadota bacterium]
MSAFWQPAEARTERHDIPPDRLVALANRFVDMTADKGVSSSCQLHLIEVENFAGPLLSQRTVRALELSLDNILRDRFPEAGCKAAFVKGYDSALKGEIARLLTNDGRPGFLYTLSFFPRDEGLLLLATAYRPDGQFAAFSNKVLIDTVQVKSDDDAVVADEPVLGLDVPKAFVDADPPAEFGSLAAVGTPAEIARIKAKKIASMPAAPAPLPPPEVGLRIDIGGAVDPAVIKTLAGAFLHQQVEGPSIGTVIEDTNRLKLQGVTTADLRGIELLDNDREAAFESLFRGDVDLVVASDPISQAQYDRFAEAFGVDMRSGAGETVIGIDAASFVVHPENRLSSLTKDLAANIFRGNIASWDEANVARSGLAGPIQALAPAYDLGVQIGRTMRPDLVLNTSFEIIDLVELNPLSIGIANAIVVEGRGHRTLAIEECGIVYPTDNFLLRTEDHPLARRLFLYSNPAKGNRFRNAFLFFATSEAGQDLVSRHAVDLDVAFGGWDRTVERIKIIESQPAESPNLKAELIDIIGDARRLSTTFRFRFDSPELRLDQHAARDLANLIKLSQREQIDPRRLMLLGFADADGHAGYNEVLSLQRAQAIAKRLRTYGIDVPTSNILGFGEEAPIACNTRPDGTNDEVGKARNRRVEIWLRSEAS